DFHVTGVQTCALPIYRPEDEDTPEAPLPEAAGVGGTRIAPPEGLVSSPVQQELTAILRDAGAMTFSDSQTLEAYVMRRAEAAGKIGRASCRGGEGPRQ